MDRRARDRAYEERRALDEAAREASRLWRSGRGKATREQQLREHPLCAWCEEVGVTRLATEVDHVVGRVARPDLIFEPSNLQSLCSSCHARKSAAERRRSMRADVRRVVVCGLPGSGKSTYVAEHKRPGSVVWDFDVVLAALTGLPHGDRPADMDGTMLAMLNALVRSVLLTPPDRDVWVIVADEAWARDLAARLGAAEVVALSVEDQERARRLEERDARRATA